MEFETIEPLQIRTKSINMINSVKIGFPKTNKGKRILVIQFGNAIAQQMGVKVGDKIEFGISKASESVYFIRKATKFGWAVYNAGTDIAPVYRMHVRWDKEIPEAAKDGYKFCSHDIYSGGVRIFLPTASVEDRILL